MTELCKLHPGNMKRQSEQAIRRLQIENEALRTGNTALSAFISDSTNRGLAFDNVRRKMRDFQRAADALILANDADMADHRILINSVGDVVLDGAVILSRLEHHRNSQRIFEDRLNNMPRNRDIPEMMRNQQNSNSSNSAEERRSWAFLSSHHATMASNYELKIEHFAQISEATSSLFQAGEGLRSSAVQGLRYIQSAAVGLPNSYNSAGLTAWRDDIAMLKDNAVTQILLNELAQFGENGTLTEESWAMIEALLRSPAEDWSESQALVLASILVDFVERGRGDYITRFLSYLATHIGDGNRWESFVARGDVMHWEFDSQKLYTLMSTALLLSDAIRERQDYLYQLGDQANNRERAILSNLKYSSFQTNALLCLLNRIQSDESAMPFRSEAGASGPMLNIIATEDGGLSITFSNSSTTWILPGTLPVIDNLFETTMTLGVVVTGDELASQVGENANGFFSAHEKITFGEMLMQDAAPFLRDQIASTAAGRVPGVGYFHSIVNFMVNTLSEVQKENQLRTDILNTTNAVGTAGLASNMGLYGTTITTAGSSAQQVIFFPSHTTNIQIGILNGLIRDVFGEGARIVTLYDIHNDPGFVQKMIDETDFRNLHGRGHY